MSYNQAGQYQQPPPGGYYDPNNQYGQQEQNGGYAGQYGQAQYPGQPSYGQYQQEGGAVQQPQGGYQEPSAGAYPGQPQYNYNPQHYAPQPPQRQASTQQYNQRSYASSGQAGYAQQYNPQDYSPASPYPNSSTYSSATSGPVDPYAFSESNYPPQRQTSYAQSPRQQSFSATQPYSPQIPGHQYGYQSSPPPLQQHPSYRPPSTTASPSQDVPYPTPGYQIPPQRTASMQLPHQPSYNISPALPGLTDDYPSPPSYPLNDTRQSPSPLYPQNTLPSPPSPGPTPPAHGFSRSNTLAQHPGARPLPGRPESDYFRHQNNDRRHLSRAEQEALTQEDLFQQVENAVLNAGRPGDQSPRISVSQAPYDAGRSAFASASGSVRRNGSVVNGHLSPAPPEPPAPYYGSDSDAEGSQGLAMLRMAEEDDTRRQSTGSQMRFSSGYGSQRSPRQTHLMPQPEASDSDDYGGVDMSSFGGGFDVGHLSYGGEPSVLAAGGDLDGYDAHSQQPSSQHSSMRRSHASQSSNASRREYDYNMDSIHPFPPFNAAARVDAGGTGGLSEPTADGRRQSYDEGDEYVLMDANMPDRFPDEPPDIFYQPASTSYRPLPNLPEGEGPPPLQTDFKTWQGQPSYPAGPDGFTTMNQQGQYVPRSTSLVSHQTTPQVEQPLRSKTDAEQRRLRQQQLRTSALSTIDSTPSLTPSIDLPTLPGKRFMPSQLGAPAFKKCDEPWSLMSILKWLLQITTPEQVTELREAEVKEALVALFTNKVATMNIADAEGLSNRVVQDMYAAGTLVTTEEWVKIVPGPMSGVIFQLTGGGCYSPTLHDHVIPGRCYSHHCQRTLKKVNLREQPVRTSESWAEFYKLKKEDVEGKDKRELERQNVLHEIVHTEDVFMEQLSILKTLYRDPLASVEPSIITPKRKDKFLKDVFGKVEAIRQANEEHLLPQLKYRQQEQGPWIVGFSDIFRQWIRKAKAAYIDYAGGFPGATFLVRQEVDRNVEFRNFIDRARNDKRSMKLGWDTFLKAPITRLQRYTLLLNTVLKNMKTDSEEKANLKVAFDEVRAVTMECDGRVAEMQRKVDLADLGSKLVLRPGMQNAVELNLDHFGRELIYRGDLQRMGGNRFTWLDSHALLFDHYLVLAKMVGQRSEQGGRIDKFDVSRLPIPMDLLILESTNDPPVQKRDYVKGITSVRDVAGARTGTPQDPSGLTRVMTNGGAAPQLQHTNTASSVASLQTVTSLGEGKDADRIMYPFKVKHLGRESYALFAPTEGARKEWVTKILEAKTKHAAALYNQNAEPFKLRVMADSAFVYDAFATGNKSVVINGSPVDRAIKEVEQRFKDTGRPAAICRARVNCATSFTTPYPGKQMVAVGTDYGVYLSEIDNPRGWLKAISANKVTQVAVLEEFNLFLLISEKSLIAYKLDVVCATTSSTPLSSSSDSGRDAPQKISGSRDVGFFVIGRMKDRTLVFYKKRENLASVFKVQEPVFQKATEKKRGFLKRGNTDFFRDYDEFYIPAECGGVNLFHSSLAVSTARGFEVLTLDKKQPWSVPELKAPHVQNIATHIKDQKALAMLRLSEQEFLLVYANCAVYVNKHGDVSRSVIMEFVGNAQSAALYGAYLLLFDSDFVEIRNAQNGRLKQIIAGREVKCLDDGGSWSAANQQPINGTANGPAVGGRTVKLVMQHPETERTQIVVELLLNENMKE